MFIFAPIRWSFRIIELFVFLILAYLIGTGVQVALASRTTANVVPVPTSSAIVLFGSDVIGNQPGPDLLARLQQVDALYLAHKAPMVFVSGETPAPGAIASSSVAVQWLTNAGVPPTALTSLSPANNAGALAQIRQLDGPNTQVIVVTDAIDSLWTRAAGSSAGLMTTVSPPSSSIKQVYSEPGPFWHQATGVAVGRVIGYGRAGWAAN